MNIKELQTKLDQFRATYTPALQEETARIETELNAAKAKLTVQARKSAMVKLLESTKPATDASQTLLSQWIEKHGNSLLRPGCKHFIITSANIESPVDQIGHVFHRMGGNAVLYKALRSVHAGIIGDKLDGGFADLSNDLFRDQAVGLCELTHFCRAVNTVKLEALEQALLVDEVALVHLESKLLLLTEMRV